MSFSVGDAVLVVAINRRGEIVERRGPGYRVAVGALTLTCRESELRAAAGTASRGRQRKEQGVQVAPVAMAHPASGTAASTAASVDLHGMSRAEAQDAVLRHIDKALRDGRLQVEVVHGIGTGRVRAAVLEVLKGLPSIRHVCAHPTNRGVTLVDLG